MDAAGVGSLTGVYAGTLDLDPDPLGVYKGTNSGPKLNTFLLRLGQT